MSESFAAPSALFDLSDFPHAALFDGIEHAWQALGEHFTAYMDEHTVDQRDGTIDPGAFVQGKIMMAPTATIEAGAHVTGPVILGPGTVVRHGAYLRGYILAGKDCILGHSTEVKNSVFLDVASAGHFNYVGDSILGKRVNLGAGCKLANFRVFPGNVNVVDPNGGLVQTGMLKLGSLLGDDVAIGCNAVAAPGTIVGRGTCVYSLASIRGTIAPNTIVSFKPELKQRTLRRR